MGEMIDSTWVRVNFASEANVIKLSPSILSSKRMYSLLPDPDQLEILWILQFTAACLRIYFQQNGEFTIKRIWLDIYILD